MDRFQNIHQVSSPSSSQIFDPTGSRAYIRRGSQVRNFTQSGVRGDRHILNDLSLARSGFMSASTVYDSNVKSGGISRSLGNLPQDRIRKIAKDFISLYGSNNELGNNSMYRMQRQAYEKCSTKPQIGQESVKQLSKVMDQNMDGRVTEEDMISLCRRYLACDKRPIVYTPMVLERLAVARRLFQQFDVEKRGYLTQKQVPNLLSETYKSLGRSFSATEEDVKSWMKLADYDGNGQVTIDEYEKSIIRALKKQGIKIYQE